MARASLYVRTWVVSCGLLAAACADDASANALIDSGAQPSHDAAFQDAGEARVQDASSQAGSGSDPTCTASISLQDFKLVPDNPTVSAGSVVLCAYNDGKAPHDLGLRGPDMQTLQKTATLAPGDTGRITLTLAAGSFAIYCSQAGHESLGMKGTLTVH